MPIFIACAFYLALFILWRQSQPELILFYQGLLMAVAVSVAQALIQRRLRHDTPVKDALLSLTLCYSFMFTIPTTVDRAYSVRMLAELESSQDGLSREELALWFTREFARQGGIDKRLEEQQATGSIEQRNGKYRITPLGQWLVTAFAHTHRVFNTAEPGRP